jgi:hypothetical protein
VGLQCFGEIAPASKDTDADGLKEPGDLSLRAGDTVIIDEEGEKCVDWN